MPAGAYRVCMLTSQSRCRTTAALSHSIVRRACTQTDAGARVVNAHARARTHAHAHTRARARADTHICSLSRAVHQQQHSWHYTIHRVRSDKRSTYALLSDLPPPAAPALKLRQCLPRFVGRVADLLPNLLMAICSVQHERQKCAEPRGGFTGSPRDKSAHTIQHISNHLCVVSFVGAQHYM